MGSIRAREAAAPAAAQEAPAAAESTEEKLYAMDAPTEALKTRAHARPLGGAGLAQSAEAGSGQFAAVHGSMVNSREDGRPGRPVHRRRRRDAGAPGPGGGPHRRAARGSPGVWDEGDRLICRLGDFVFVPADPAEIDALLEG
jgi:hypothetical protein